MKKTTLKNGLRIITAPLKNTRATTVLVLVKTGSKYEEKNLSGISHFLEHMLFKKTKKRPSPLKISEELDKIGGDYNAFTGEDYTGYYAKVESAKTELALDWVSDIYLNSLLPKDELEKERGVIKEEINMYYDNPMSYVQLLFEKLLYGDQPAGWDIAGTKETVSKMKRDDLFEYMKKQYVGKNTVVVIAGGFDVKKIEEKAVRIFSKLKKGEPKEKVEVVEKQNKPEVLLSYKKTDQTHLVLGARAFNSFSKQSYSQKIMASILGGMMSSRLFIKIRDELGLAYYIKTAVEENPDTGVLLTFVGAENSKTKDAIKAIMEEYKKIKEEKVSAKELKKAKDNLKGGIALSLEASDDLAHFYGKKELLLNKTIEVEELFSLIDKVTAREIQETAKEIFVPEKINLAIVGPHKNKKEFEELLK